ncbi:MAG TPA: O-methyltransferase [Dehalococcoidia bacterium]|nr:O-methyltransferase [Dehalococcoidia bacterium]
MEQRLARVLRRLEREDREERERGVPQHLRLRAVTPEVGRFLNLMTKAIGARRILEIGTSGGYSTLWLADAARETGGAVTTLELDPAKVERARRTFVDAGVDRLVTVVPGDARETLATLEPGFDLVFLDAEKDLYLELLEPLVRLLRPGGLLIADNLLSHADDLAAFRQAAERHPELDCVLVPIPRGELLCRKRIR